MLAELAARVASARPYLRWITAARGANVRLITLDDICYFQSDTKYTRAVTTDSESLIHTPLKELPDTLDPAQFWQIHRSTIVNANAIDSVGREVTGHVIAAERPPRDAARQSAVR